MAPSDTMASSSGSKPKERLDVQEAPAVRFSSAVQEMQISPVVSHHSQDAHRRTAPTEDEILELKQTLQGAQLQNRGMAVQYQFEPFSLPVSRVQSHEESGNSSRVSTPNSLGVQSPHISSTTTAVASPPLTPAATDSASRERKTHAKEDSGKAANLNLGDASLITPQASTSHERPVSPRPTLPSRPVSDYGVIRASSAEDSDSRTRSHRKGMFAVGADSTPVSRDSSPSRLSAAYLYSKPITPAAEPNDPYAASKRKPQQTNPSRQSIDPQFVFARKRHVSPNRSSTTTLAERRSMVFGAFKLRPEDTTDSGTSHSRVTSVADLKRFFKRNGKKREGSPASRAGARTPPTSSRLRNGMFFDDQALTTKYGKLGKLLGSGAGGSVRLMKRREDGLVFAVKEFRARHNYESEKQYSKKVTAEFCVGSTLHHGNIIETLDIVQEKGRWYQVMEYAPFDLFAIVMTGRMKREEVTCCFLQILNGVTYLHSMGLAHRDLKLDNVVVSKDGIMKIIDFGSAHVFKYPFESGVVRAKGIVGSDPYLAPEVYDSKDYDAQAADIWSLAIIFSCMTLRRFPWKIPRSTDNSYKLFVAEPTAGHDPKHLILQHRNNQVPVHTPWPAEALAEHKAKVASPAVSSRLAHPTPPTSAANATFTEKKETIKGPWRILRLLPRESRHIIYRMLDTNSLTRATMNEILEEPWVSDTVICRQTEDGEITHADDHAHTLEPPAPQPMPA